MKARDGIKLAGRFPSLFCVSVLFEPHKDVLS
jgi:hypothetical protein